MPKHEYLVSCQLTSEEDRDLLHIEVRCSVYPSEVYSRHFGFEELDGDVQKFFKNL